MRSRTLVSTMEKYALAVFTFDPNGALMADPLVRSFQKARLKLIALVGEDFDGEKRVVAEIGVGHTHPYRSDNGHLNLRLPRRNCPQLLSEKQLRSIASELITVMNRVVAERARGKRWHLTRVRRDKATGAMREFNVTRHDRFLRGVSFSVHGDDDVLCRFFEEWALLNTLDLEPKLDRLAFTLNRTNLGPRRLPRGRPWVRGPRTKDKWVRNAVREKMWQNGYPAGYRLFRELLGASRRKRTPLPFMLRPAFLAPLCRRLDQPYLFLQFLLGNELVSHEVLDCVVKALERRDGFRCHLLPSSLAKITGAELHKRNDTLAVVPSNRAEDCWSFLVTLKSAEWARKQEEERRRIVERGKRFYRVARLAKAEFGDGNHIAEDFEVPEATPEELAALGELGN